MYKKFHVVYFLALEMNPIDRVSPHNYLLVGLQLGKDLHTVLSGRLVLSLSFAWCLLCTEVRRKTMGKKSRGYLVDRSKRKIVSWLFWVLECRLRSISRDKSSSHLSFFSFYSEGVRSTRHHSSKTIPSTSIPLHSIYLLQPMFPISCQVQASMPTMHASSHVPRSHL